jgi:hypothetical protein
MTVRFCANVEAKSLLVLGFSLGLHSGVKRVIQKGRYRDTYTLFRSYAVILSVPIQIQDKSDGMKHAFFL